MKRILALLTLSCLMYSCSKSSSSPSYSGTVSFTVNGKQAVFSGASDTSNGIGISGRGLFPGSTDSASIVLNLLAPGVSPSAYQGYFYDSSSKQNASLDVLDITTVNDYQSGSKNLTVQITSNNGELLEGTFQGEVYLVYGASTVDSLGVSNGTFTISY